jgi:hypothetical protein
MCKVNFADAVKIILPSIARYFHILTYCLKDIIAKIVSSTTGTTLTFWKYIGIIILTNNATETMGAHDAKFFVNRLQNQNATRSGRPQSPTGRCSRSTFCGKRFFRSTRSCASQIRDGAPSSHRRLAPGLYSAGLWLFTRHFLPGFETLQAGWHGWASPEIARPQKCPQALGRFDEFRGRGHDRRSNAALNGPFRYHQGSVRHLCPPSQHRTGTCSASKKTAQVAASSCGYRELRERYEILREQVLSQLSGGWGLGVLLHQGMAAWMQRGRSTLTEGKPARGHTTHIERATTGNQTDIVMILAGMALCCAKGGENDG